VVEKRGLRFAFYGRTSTAEFQDQSTSRAWQREMAETLIVGHGVVTEEFFDVGCSRRLPWERRPRAAALLSQAAIEPRVRARTQALATICSRD